MNSEIALRTGTPRPVMMSWSGGKDSTLALERLLADPTVRVAGLLTTVSTVYDRISIHGVRRSILQQQAEALRLPLFEVQLGADATNTQYADAFAAGLARVRHAVPDVDTIAFGDLYLEDVRAYRDAMLATLGWRGSYPIWGEPTSALARDFVARGFRAILSCVDTQQLDAAFAGRWYDDALLDALPSSIDPCGENGEFHTCVLDGPIFGRAIDVSIGERVLRDERFQYCDLIPRDQREP